MVGTPFVLADISPANGGNPKVVQSTRRCGFETCFDANDWDDGP